MDPLPKIKNGSASFGGSLSPATASSVSPRCRLTRKQSISARVVEGADQMKVVGHRDSAVTLEEALPRAGRLIREVIFFLVLLMLAGTSFAQSSTVAKSVASARKQISVTTSYDPEYTVLSYPNGDVPRDRGVCTDVIIRALRDAYHMDLQKLVHEDMQKDFSAYPHQWGLSHPDKNIDHRRVPNLQTYFKRHALSLKISDQPDDFLPGDIVTVMLPGNLPHIMLVSDAKTASGTPLVIHNIGGGTQEENCLFEFPITGHYRLTASAE